MVAVAALVHCLEESDLPSGVSILAMRVKGDAVKSTGMNASMNAPFAILADAMANSIIGLEDHADLGLHGCETFGAIAMTLADAAAAAGIATRVKAATQDLVVHRAHLAVIIQTSL